MEHQSSEHLINQPNFGDLMYSLPDVALSRHKRFFAELIAIADIEVNPPTPQGVAVVRGMFNVEFPNPRPITETEIDEGIKNYVSKQDITQSAIRPQKARIDTTNIAQVRDEVLAGLFHERGFSGSFEVIFDELEKVKNAKNGTSEVTELDMSDAIQTFIKTSQILEWLANWSNGPLHYRRDLPAHIGYPTRLYEKLYTELASDPALYSEIGKTRKERIKRNINKMLLIDEELHGAIKNFFGAFYNYKDGYKITQQSHIQNIPALIIYELEQLEIRSVEDGLQKIQITAEKRARIAALPELGDDALQTYLLYAAAKQEEVWSFIDSITKINKDSETPSQPHISLIRAINYIKLRNEGKSVSLLSDNSISAASAFKSLRTGRLELLEEVDGTLKILGEITQFIFNKIASDSKSKIPKT